MKVRTGYRDGIYWVEAYTAEHAAAGLAGVDFPDDLWPDYNAHMIKEREWQQRLLALDNEQWVLDHPEK